MHCVADIFIMSKSYHRSPMHHAKTPQAAMDLHFKSARVLFSRSSGSSLTHLASARG